MLVLASASPRRRALLEAAGLRFRVEVSGVDEEDEAAPEPSALALSLARRKAVAVAQRLGGTADRWVVGADTVVAVPRDSGWCLLGKPRDAAEAAEMLGALSATRHAVITGICVVGPGPADVQEDLETTWVTMRRIEPAEITAYVASGEWRDKAGGYAIQETADRFVRGLEGGGFDNVVGLPVARTLALLARAGHPVPR